MYYRQIFLAAICLNLLFFQVNSSVVCSEDEFVKEILEDLADNGLFNNFKNRKT